GGMGCMWGGSGAQERVYYFVVPTGGRMVTFDGCGMPMVYDETAFIRDICTMDGTAIACNDDAHCGGMLPMVCGDPGEASTVSATLAPGLYYFFADGFNDPGCPCGDFSYAISGL